MKAMHNSTPAFYELKAVKLKGLHLRHSGGACWLVEWENTPSLITPDHSRKKKGVQYKFGEFPPRLKCPSGDFPVKISHTMEIRAIRLKLAGLSLVCIFENRAFMMFWVGTNIEISNGNVQFRE